MSGGVGVGAGVYESAERAVGGVIDIEVIARCTGEEILLVNGIPAPINALDFNVEKNEFMIGYQLFLNLTNNKFVTPEDYKSKGYFIIPFGLRKPFESDGLSPTQEGTVRLQLSFHEALAQKIDVLFYYEIPGVITIDAQDNVEYYYV